MTEQDFPAFDQAINRLAVAAQTRDPLDAHERKVYFKRLMDLEIEFILEAGAELERTARWFPKIGEWRDATIALERRKRDAQLLALRKLRAPLCGLCGDTGWKPVTEGKPDVEFCGCRRERRLELLGRRQCPLQLTGQIEDIQPDPMAAEKIRQIAATLGMHKGMA